MKRLLIISLLTAIVAAAVANSSAQSKVNLSGTWKLNPSKSDFGQVPVPESEIQVIEQKEQTIKLNVDRKGGPGGDRKYSYELTTDGKEAAQTFGDSPAKRSARLDGDAVVIKTATKFEENDITIESKYTLDKDGKTLSIASHVSGGFGEFDIKEIFDKQ